VLAAPLERAALEGEAVSLAELLEELVVELPAADRDRIALRLDGEGLVRGDPVLLRSMLVNAIGNALKFSASAPVAVRLEEAGGAGPDGAPSVQVTVVDHGPGIPEDQRERVFEPFYRVRSDATPGTASAFRSSATSPARTAGRRPSWTTPAVRASG
jgi:two-component system sensor histidine kinase KdpD